VILDSRGNVAGQIKLMTGLAHRIRDVRVGPDGYVYLLTDDTDGAMLRMEPAKQ
jgi:glucose/arabinose dehydrogenase